MNATKYKIAVSAIVLLGLTAYADEKSKFALPLSASLGVGSMESGDLDLKSRTMSAYSFEALPSYRWGQWLIGPHFDYRIQPQLTSLDDAGGTNLKGQGWLIGLGARYDHNDRFFVQGAIDFLGSYDLSKDTAAGEDDYLKSPLGLRIKTGYAFLENIPNLTFDADLQYLRFREIHIAGTDSTKAVNQLIAALGITYQFGFGKKTSAPAEVQAPPEPPAVPKATEKIAQIKGVEKVGDALRLSLPGASFNTGSAVLNPEAKSNFVEAAKLIAQSNATIRVEGHTDSVGNLQKNNALSKARAETVKAFLIEHGVSADKVSAQGFGPSQPIADNKTKEGRAQNRRVEILIQEGGQ